MRDVIVGRRRVLGAAARGAASLVAFRAVRALAAAERVNVVATQGVTGLTLQEVARGQGFFTEYGLEENVLLVSDSAKCVAALISGAAKVCLWSGFNQLMPAIERGAKVKILAGALNLPSLALYSRRPDIHEVKDLEGKVIGIGAPGAVLHQMTALLLRKKGVAAEKVTFRNVGSNADIFKAVVAGTVDAGLSDVDVFEQQERYGVHALSDGILWLEIPEYTNQATYASDTAIQESRDLLVRLLAAYAKAYRFVSGPQSRDAFLQARRKITGAADPKEAITQWNWIQKYRPYATDLVLSQDQIDLVQRLNVEFKMQRQILPMDQVADMSLARDALKLVG